MGLGATWWFYKIMMVRIMIIDYQHDHRDHDNNLCHNHYLVQSTRTGWKRTIFLCADGSGGPRAPTIRLFHNLDRQQHFSVIIIVTIIILREGTFIHRHFKEISEICYIHIYIYTLSYLQYIQIYTNIYNYIQVVMRHMKERWLVSRHTTQNIMRNTRWRCRL